MKKLSIITIVSVISLLHTIPVVAREWEKVSKEKKLHGQYTVQANDKLVIDNIYGKVHINTWDKNEITIDITATAKARNEGDAQEILDRIRFIIETNENGGHRISYRTTLDNARHSIQNTEMTIDYTINMPKTNPIDINDKYGNVFLADFAGKMEMTVKYGNLETRSLSGPDKHITVAYGNANIGAIETGDLDISYSNLTIDRATDIDVSCKYGKSDISSVQDLKIDNKYGNLDIGTVARLAGDISYANLEIGQLLKSVNLTVKYCGKVDLGIINAAVDLIKLNAYYSTIHSRLAEGTDLSMDISTSYSNVKTHSSSRPVEFTTTDIGDNNGHYKAKTGKGTGSFIINAHYSNINFR